MNEPANFNANEEQAEPEQPAVLRPRVVGAPLSSGASRRVPQSSAEEDTGRFAPPQPDRASENASSESVESSNVQRAVNMLRATLPFLQRLLPLLDGNVATAVGSLLASRSNSQAARSARLDLAPVEDGLAELRSQQHSLRLQVTEQNISLKNVEDQLQKVREITSRNMLEQQEVLEDLKALGNRIKMIAAVALLLAAAGFLATLALFLQMKKMLP